MIGAKRVGSKASSAHGALADLRKTVANVFTLDIRTGAAPETNWDAIEAAKDFAAAQQRFDVEKYRVLLRRY
jgi:hypothetical protein